MQGIHYAAILTTIAALAIFGTWIAKLKQPANERWLTLAMLTALPLQPLAFHFIRLPFDHWLVAQLGMKSLAYQWLTSFYAPLTEEPAKLIPLLIPMVFRDIRQANFARYALAIGLGFAIGEMWFLADVIAQSPAYQNVPFDQFTGFIAERLMVCLFHSAFVCVALWQLTTKSALRFLLGVAGAMTLHWLGNFPILLMAWNVGGIGKPAWMFITQMWLAIGLIGALAMFAFFINGKFEPGLLLYGRRRCPGCDAEYDASLFAVNLGVKRYERCPHCMRWHWTKRMEPDNKP